MIEIVADPGATWRISGEPWERSWDRMRRLMDATKAAGAQTFKPQYYVADIYPRGTAEWDLLKPYELPVEWLPRIKEECDQRGLEFMCTVYRPEDVPLLAPLVKRWKVASFESQHTWLLAALRRTKKPVIVSLGMTDTHGWIDGVSWWRQVILLHCVSAYPAAPAQMNLRAIFNWNYELDSGDVLNGPKCSGAWIASPMGLSDHSRGNTAAIIAVAYGASVIEKHIRADDTPPNNPDYPHSASPAEFQEYVAAVREAELMLGDGVKRIMSGEETAWRWNAKTGRRGVKA